MSAPADAAAAASAVEDVKLHLDEVTGEMISKSYVAALDQLDGTDWIESLLIADANPSPFDHLYHSELKKRLKNREKEAKKAEKAASAPAPATSEKAAKKTVSAAEEEENLNPNVCLVNATGVCRLVKWLNLTS